jgi:hypothetical protein
MGNQELKKSLESMENLRLELSTSREKTLEFLIRAGIVTADEQLVDTTT